MQSNVDILVEMVKFDMQQIQTYREIILKIAIMCIVASWSTSAFLWGSRDLTPKHRLRIAMTVNTGLLLVSIVAAVGYFSGLDISRACLDKREDTLKAWITNNSFGISANDIYPNCHSLKPRMSSQLEKCPLYVTGAALVAMSIIECSIFKRSKERPQME